MAVPENPRYAELQVTSNFSFLRGASHPDELAIGAAVLGLEAIAVTDRNSLAGIVRAHVGAKQAGIRLVVGARLDLGLGSEKSKSDPIFHTQPGGHVLGVIPAKAGIQTANASRRLWPERQDCLWTPASASVTQRRYSLEPA